MSSLADSGSFLDCQYQGGVKPTVFGVFEALKFKISRRLEPKLVISLVCPVSCLSLDETANWAEAGNHQFWSEPSEILSLRSSNTPETVDFTPP